jgi:hypothetical protein
MKDIKELEKSMILHSKKAIQEIQLIRFRLEAEYKEPGLTEADKYNIEKDLTQCDNIIDAILSFHVTDEAYKIAESSLFSGGVR